MNKEYPVILSDKKTEKKGKYSEVTIQKLAAYEALYNAKRAAKGVETTAVKSAQAKYDELTEILALIRVEIDSNGASDNLKYTLNNLESRLAEFEGLWKAERDADAAKDDFASSWKKSTKAEQDAAKAERDAAQQKAEDLYVIRAEALRQCGAECL